jgi:hypothetical protein
LNADRATREKIQEAGETDDVFFEAMMSMVEGSIGAMSAALAFATGESQSADAPAPRRSNSRDVPPAQEIFRILGRKEGPQNGVAKHPPSDDESDEETDTSDVSR